MGGNGKTESSTTLEKENGVSTLTPQDVLRLFGDGYREVEVLRDGSVRERPRDGDVTDETVTRTLKTGRTWY